MWYINHLDEINWTVFPSKDYFHAFVEPTFICLACDYF